MKGAIWGGMAKCGGGGAGWLAPKSKACCRRLSGMRIYANLKQMDPTGDAIWDRGSDWSPFTCVRVGGRELLYGSKSGLIGSKFAPDGACGWAAS